MSASSRLHAKRCESIGRQARRPRIEAAILGFLGNFFVGNAIDASATSSLGEALAIDIGLLALFALQHSVMARPAFKRWWVRIVPAAAERSTYVLLSSLALILSFWQWRPIGASIWNVESEAARLLIYAGYASGWILLLLATFLIIRFDLFGLRQVWMYFRGGPYTELVVAALRRTLVCCIRSRPGRAHLKAVCRHPTKTSAHLRAQCLTAKACW